MDKYKRMKRDYAQAVSRMITDDMYDDDVDHVEFLERVNFLHYKMRFFLSQLEIVKNRDRNEN